MNLNNIGTSRPHATTLPSIPLLALTRDENKVFQISGDDDVKSSTESSILPTRKGDAYPHDRNTSVPLSRRFPTTLKQHTVTASAASTAVEPLSAVTRTSHTTTESRMNIRDPRPSHCLAESHTQAEESYAHATMSCDGDADIGDQQKSSNDDGARTDSYQDSRDTNNAMNMTANSINHVSEVSDGDDFGCCHICDVDKSSSQDSADAELDMLLDEDSLTHVGGDNCVCPMCRLGGYIYYLFSHQRRASAHVIAARPSTHNSSADKGGSLTALQSVSRPANTQVCPVFAAYSFCPYGSGCYLPHFTRRIHRIVPVRNADDELAHLHALARQHEESDVWVCNVCGQDGITELHTDSTIEFYYYRQCPRCTLMCYFPHVTHLLNCILTYVGDDYQLYKNEVSRYRQLVPDEFKVPLSFEAHRLATVVFAWSLFSPANAKDAIDAAYRALPELQSIVSMGAGTGYIEHVFNRVMHNVVTLPKHTIDRTRFPVSSFDGIHASFYNKKVIPIFAFDDLALRCRYSVHVSIGGPLSLLSIDCKRAVLLLCWPPFGSPQGEQSSMGFEALEYFTQRGGRIVIYIGDIVSTGDWRFHQLLHTHYKLVRGFAVRREVRRWYPQDMGLIYAGNDTYGVYERREQPIVIPTS